MTGPVRDSSRWRFWHETVPRRRKVSGELRDLIGCGLAGPVAFTPDDYGLSRSELIHEGHCLSRAGLGAAEIGRVLVAPHEIPEDGWC